MEAPIGFVSGLLGTAGGVNGTGISGPSGTDENQLKNAYNQTNSGIAQQQAFVNALGQTNGLQNQSDVFAQQQGLANQLQGVASGTGPNPALAQLNQATGANTANQAALMAGQRGAGQNVGLIGRQAAMQGGANQQQAAGQAATLQAQQQLAAMAQLQGQQANMGNLATTQVGQQQTGLNALNDASLRQQGNLLGVQASINSANSGMAQQTMGGQQNLLGNIAGGVGSVFGLAQGGMIPKYAEGDMVQQGTYGNIDYSQPSVFPPSTNIVPTDLNAPAANPVAAAPQQAPAPTAAGPKSRLGQALHGMAAPSATNVSQQPNKLSGMSLAGNTLGKGIGAGIKRLVGGSSEGSTYNPSDEQQLQNQADANVFMNQEANRANQGDMQIGPETESQQRIGTESDLAASNDLPIMGAEGGKVPALVSPGEIYLKPNQVSRVANGASPEKVGKKIPGKPKVKGAVNSYANDTVKASLDEGGIVIPRSITQGKNPHWEAMKFVHQTLAKNGKIPKKGK